MKWAYYIRYKLKAAMVLTIIMVVILLSNFSERRSFTHLDTSMTSIYQDRLKPAAFLYEISNHLYQKRLLHDGNRSLSQQEIQASIAQHNAAIAALIGQYETTVLTKEEQQQWALFKKHLAGYDALEKKWADSYAGSSNQSIHAVITRHFDATINDLNSLNKIQVGEGNNLQKSSHSIVSNTLLLSYLEITLLIVLSLFTLIILSTTDHTLFKNSRNQALN